MCLNTRRRAPPSSTAPAAGVVVMDSMAGEERASRAWHRPWPARSRASWEGETVPRAGWSLPDGEGLWQGLWQGMLWTFSPPASARHSPSPLHLSPLQQPEPRAAAHLPGSLPLSLPPLCEGGHACVWPELPRRSARQERLRRLCFRELPPRRFCADDPACAFRCAGLPSFFVFPSGRRLH